MLIAETSMSLWWEDSFYFIFFRSVLFFLFSCAGHMRFSAKLFLFSFFRFDFLFIIFGYHRLQFDIRTHCHIKELVATHSLSIICSILLEGFYFFFSASTPRKPMLRYIIDGEKEIRSFRLFCFSRASLLFQAWNFCTESKTGDCPPPKNGISSSRLHHISSDNTRK